MVYPSQYPDNPQAGPYKGGTGDVTTKEGTKMFFLRGRNTLLPGLPGTQADDHQTGR